MIASYRAKMRKHWHDIHASSGGRRNYSRTLLIQINWDGEPSVYA